MRIVLFFILIIPCYSNGQSMEEMLNMAKLTHTQLKEKVITDGYKYYDTKQLDLTASMKASLRFSNCLFMSPANKEKFPGIAKYEYTGLFVSAYYTSYCGVREYFYRTSLMKDGDYPMGLVIRRDRQTLKQSTDYLKTHGYSLIESSGADLNYSKSNGEYSVTISQTEDPDLIDYAIDQCWKYAK